MHNELARTFFVWAVTLIGSFFLFHNCEAEAKVRPVKAYKTKSRVKIGKGKNEDVGLWIARSCVGEAGFSSGTTKECAAIAHIYLKREKLTQFNLYQVTRRYSAAIKKGPHQKREWVFHLSRDSKKPEHWPKHLSWQKHKPLWNDVLNQVDGVLKGEVKDPLPLADHYGGAMDRHRAHRYSWHKLKTPDFENMFWSTTCPKKKEKAIMKKKELLTADEAAELMGIASNTFRTYCRAGKFDTARKLRGTTWVIEKEEIDKLVSGEKEINFSGAWRVLETRKGYRKHVQATV